MPAMTVSSWVDVPHGTPCHHHCVVSIEARNDPQYWTDASTATPDLVAWHPRDALEWVHDQLVKHQDQAVADYGRRQWIDDALNTYRPFGDLPRPTSDELPDRWVSMANALRNGRWIMPTFQLGMSRLLVMQVLSYGDADQSGQAGSKTYSVCRQHRRPDEQPYQPQ